MTHYFPIIVEQASNGTFSAWVAGLPGVYAAADTATAAKRGIRGALAAHLDALRTLGREPQLKADVTVLRRDVYPYDLSADGQRFLVNTLIQETASSAITLVVNWTAGLKK